jgi:hypothetical protein
LDATLCKRRPVRRFQPDGFYADLPILMDTGINNMILWVGADDARPNWRATRPITKADSATG